MWSLLALFGGALVLWLLVTPFVAWAQGGTISRLREEVTALRGEVAALRGQLAILFRANPDLQNPYRGTEDAPPALPPAEVAPAAEPAPEAAPADEHAALPAAPRANLETLIASRWMVWVGAVALALGAVFLVRYSIERGWFGPGVRVLAGLGLGAMLSAAGEWLRRRPELAPVAGLRPHHIPAAVAGGGLAAFFASVYAAYGLYGFIGTGPAFVGLAGVALATVAMALLHGQAFALFGILAGFAVPALLQSPDPWPWNVFPYLAAVAAAGLLLVRARGWWWLGWTTVFLALAWAVVWIVDVRTSADAVVVGAYLIVVALLVALARRGMVPSEPGEADFLAWAVRLASRDPFVNASLVAVAIVMLLLADRAGFSTEALFAALGLTVCLIGLARRHPSAEGGAVVAALFAILLMLAWRADLPGAYAIKTELARLARPAVLLPVVPPSLQPYAWMAGAFGLLFGAGGFALARTARTPALWGALSAAMPLVMLMLLYVATRGFEADRAWAATALALAPLALLAAERTARWRAEPGMAGVLGAYASAVCAALALAAALWLRQAWLTVAFAAMLPALAWVARRLDGLPALRWTAWAMAALVIVRLLLNPSVLQYGQGAEASLGWVVYGYGPPCIFFLLAARWFGGGARDPLVLLLQAGALAFGMAFVGFETRILAAGSLTAPGYGLMERSLHTLAWLAAGLLLLRAARGGDNPVAYWGSRILLGCAALHLAVFQLVAGNPLLTGTPVGGPVLANVLALAYAAPAVLAGLVGWEAHRQGDSTIAQAAGLGTVVLPLAYLTLEIRHAFHGPMLRGGMPGGAELYAYSVAWLAYGALLLGVALVSRAAAVRYASLAVIVAVVAKVFLWDMAGLEGILRAVSFLGLGLALVAVGYVYQRFVFRAAMAP